MTTCELLSNVKNNKLFLGVKSMGEPIDTIVSLNCLYLFLTTRNNLFWDIATRVNWRSAIFKCFHLNVYSEKWKTAIIYSNYNTFKNWIWIKLLNFWMSYADFSLNTIREWTYHSWRFFLCNLICDKTRKLNDLCYIQVTVLLLYLEVKFY